MKKYWQITYIDTDCITFEAWGKNGRERIDLFIYDRIEEWRPNIADCEALLEDDEDYEYSVYDAYFDINNMNFRFLKSHFAPYDIAGFGFTDINGMEYPIYWDNTDGHNINVDLCGKTILATD